MKEDMYTYHYFKNRCIIKPTHSSGYVFDTVIIAGIAFVGVAALVLLR